MENEDVEMIADGDVENPVENPEDSEECKACDDTGECDDSCEGDDSDTNDDPGESGDPSKFPFRSLETVTITIETPPPPSGSV